ncbi:VOC family protein [Spirillospora sp. NPDC047279]|uniref:VOC family protein n=1 Tax=Spirillospora sp. NPDC047279 TaxID=3155478 RepID=UPI00340F3EBB
MTVPTFNTVAWFQVGAEAPEDARRFYGELFGWQFDIDPDKDGYDLISYPGGGKAQGGLAHAGGNAHYEGDDNQALFMVLVEDVAAICARTERLGGKVVKPIDSTPSGLRFAYVVDPAGNRFGLFTPPMPPQ